jgi:electron transfer flavoprotein beta subunit
VKIAVCVKEVPDSTAEKKIDAGTKRLSRDTGDRTLNPYDLNAVEQAVRLKDAVGDGEVVLVSMGPSRALESMRKGLAMGADRAVLVSDDAAAGADLVATSYVLAKALERESPDLVLFGQQATDGDGAVLWAAVADRLRMPVVSQISELEVSGSEITAKRQTEFGYDKIGTALPAVLAVSDSLNEPRYPSLKGIMGAKKKPQDVLSLADIGAEASRAGEAGSRTTVNALADPPARGDMQKVDDDGSGAQQIMEYLMERKLV